jgi:dTDP-4-amino-4,6-dideoxygalactose transaminase
VIDDCTHGLGGTYRGRPNGAAALAAFYSTQWSKPISTGLGGIAVTTDAGLARELEGLERSAREPRALDRALLATMLLARERIATPRTLHAGRGVYRAVSRAGLVPGSSSGEELEGTDMPASFLTAMSGFQARLAGRRLTALAARVRRRVAVAHGYSARLAQLGCTPAAEPESARHTFLRYPLRVRERDAFVEEAHRRGVLLGDWFHSPLYPIGGDLRRWAFRRGEHPVAERVASEIVNLPTDVPPAGPQAHAVEELLGACVDRIVVTPRGGTGGPVAR